MASVHDVAAYIINRCGPLTAMKLQKLVYYSYAWHLVWEERRLFDERIQAWANGPVVYELYNEHRGLFSVSHWARGDASKLDEDEVSSTEAVLDFYSARSAHELSELTHNEEPWRAARSGLAPAARSNAEISDDVIFEYYDGLTQARTL